MEREVNLENKKEFKTYNVYYIKYYFKLLREIEKNSRVQSSESKSKDDILKLLNDLKGLFNKFISYPGSRIDNSGDLKPSSIKKDVNSCLSKLKKGGVEKKVALVRKVLIEAFQHINNYLPYFPESIRKCFDLTDPYGFFAKNFLAKKPADDYFKVLNDFLLYDFCKGLLYTEESEKKELNSLINGMKLLILCSIMTRISSQIDSKKKVEFSLLEKTFDTLLLPFKEFSKDISSFYKQFIFYDMKDQKRDDHMNMFPPPLSCIIFCLVEDKIAAEQFHKLAKAVGKGAVEIRRNDRALLMQIISKMVEEYRFLGDIKLMLTFLEEGLDFLEKVFWCIKPYEASEREKVVKKSEYFLEYLSVCQKEVLKYYQDKLIEYQESNIISKSDKEILSNAFGSKCYEKCEKVKKITDNMIKCADDEKKKALEILFPVEKRGKLLEKIFPGKKASEILFLKEEGGKVSEILVQIETMLKRVFQKESKREVLERPVQVEGKKKELKIVFEEFENEDKEIRILFIEEEEEREEIPVMLLKKEEVSEILIKIGEALTIVQRAEDTEEASKMITQAFEKVYLFEDRLTELEGYKKIQLGKIEEERKAKKKELEENMAIVNKFIKAEEIEKNKKKKKSKKNEDKLKDIDLKKAKEFERKMEKIKAEEQEINRREEERKKEAEQLVKQREHFLLQNDKLNQIKDIKRKKVKETKFTENGQKEIKDPSSIQKFQEENKVSVELVKEKGKTNELSVSHNANTSKQKKKKVLQEKQAGQEGLSSSSNANTLKQNEKFKVKGGKRTPPLAQYNQQMKVIHNYNIDYINPTQSVLVNAPVVYPIVQHMPGVCAGCPTCCATGYQVGLAEGYKLGRADGYVEEGMKGYVAGVTEGYTSGFAAGYLYDVMMSFDELFLKNARDGNVVVCKDDRILMRKVDSVEVRKDNILKVLHTLGKMDDHIKGSIIGKVNRDQNISHEEYEEILNEIHKEVIQNVPNQTFEILNVSQLQNTLEQQNIRR